MSTWVLLRGLTRESGHWGDFPDALGAALATGRVLSIDLPGNGILHAECSPLRVEEMAEHCRRQLAALGEATPCFIVAMSLGAMVAVALAARHPQLVAGCVLINTSLRPFSPFFHRLRPRAYPALLALALGRDARAREKAILRLTSSGPPDPLVLDRWLACARRHPVGRRNALRQLRAAASFKAPLQAPPVPLLVLAGAADNLVNPDCSRRLAAQWGTAYAEHPTAGHDLPLDDAPWVISQIHAWWRAAARP